MMSARFENAFEPPQEQVHCIVEASRAIDESEREISRRYAERYPLKAWSADPDSHRPPSAISPSPQARKPAYKLTIDFGPAIGVKKSSAQITRHYQPENLVGRQVAAVVNFPPRQIGPFMSEVLTLGVPDDDGAVVLLRPDFKVANGGRMF